MPKPLRHNHLVSLPHLLHHACKCVGQHPFVADDILRIDLGLVDLILYEVLVHVLDICQALQRTVHVAGVAQVVDAFGGFEVVFFVAVFFAQPLHFVVFGRPCVVGLKELNVDERAWTYFHLVKSIFELKAANDFFIYKHTCPLGICLPIVVAKQLQQTLKGGVL